MLKIYLLSVSLICFFSVYAQNKTNLLGSKNDQEILNSMNLDIYIPQGFEMVSDSKTECFENNHDLNEAFTCLSNKLISKSRECMIFISLHRLFNREDSIFISKLSPPDRPFNANQIHVNNLRNQISVLTNDVNNYSNYLSHVGSNEAKEWFNADSVLYFQTELKDNLVYEKKFDKVISLMTHKKDRGFVSIVIFYSKSSGLNAESFLDLLKYNIYYRDET